jgi:hypothetical protein
MGNLFDAQDFDINDLRLSFLNDSKHMQPIAIKINFPVFFGTNVVNIIAKIRVNCVKIVHLKD